jgi:hypothetical protein
MEKKSFKKNNILKYKLGVTYSLFSGEELLKKSILSIRDNVDYINVVYQKTSWTGIKASENQINILTSLVNEKLIDRIIEFDMSKFDVNEAARFVISKKQIGLNDIKKNKCSHVMLMDVDEFYISSQFKKAKDFVFKNKITHSFCSIYDYRFSPIIRNRDVNTYAVPFIFKIGILSKVSAKSKYPCIADIYRLLYFNKYIHNFYYLNTLIMHHMTGIRENIDLKFDATISNLSKSGAEHVEKFRNTFSNEKELEINTFRSNL